MPREDLKREWSGRRFGQLVVQWPVGHKTSGKTRTYVHWLCLCDCGNLNVVSAANLYARGARSCGCLLSLAAKQNGLASKGRVTSEETKAKLRAARAKQVTTVETRLKMSATKKARREKNNFWKGGITDEHSKIRHSMEYKLWRESVFARDKWTCVKCGKRGGTLNAHHIKPFAFHPELRFSLDNGETLCKPCHKKTDSYLWKAKAA